MTCDPVLSNTFLCLAYQAHCEVESTLDHYCLNTAIRTDDLHRNARDNVRYS